MRLMQLTSTEGILLTNRDWGREGVGCKLVMNQLIMQQPGSVCTQRSAACRWCCTPNSPQGLLRGATVHFASHFAIPRRASYRYNFLLQASPIAYTSVIQFHDSPLEKNNQETDLVSKSKDMPCCYSAVTSSSIWALELPFLPPREVHGHLILGLCVHQHAPRPLIPSPDSSSKSTA